MKISKHISSIILILIISCCFVWFPAKGISQNKPPNSRAEIDSLYELNIKKSRINGVYIPKNIDDAYEEFIHLSPETALDKFKLAPESKVVEKLHFGIGRWMIVNWNFYEGSRLSHILTGMGLMHPDDMADFLITVFHRKLNGEWENREALVESFVDKRKQQQSDMGKIHFN